jgi:hypothetical protein
MSVSSAARKLQDLLSGAVILTRLTKDGPVEVDSPRCASVLVVYERRTRRPGDGEWLIEWQGGPTREQMRAHVVVLVEVVAVRDERPLRGVQFGYRRLVSDTLLALVLDRNLRAGAFDPAMLTVLTSQPGAARAHAEYAAADTDLSDVTSAQVREYEALIGGRTGYDMGWMIPLLTARVQATEPDVTKSRDGSGCERCGGPLPASARPDARFCAAACRQAAHRARHPVTKSRDTSCAVCGKPVPVPAHPHRAGRHASHCSHACRQTAYRRRHAASQPDTSR